MLLNTFDALQCYSIAKNSSGRNFDLRKINTSFLRNFSRTTLLVCVLLSWFSVHAQDTIVLKNCEKIKAKNIRVEPVEIKYNRFENPVGTIDSVAKEKVCMIKYQNGKKEFFSDDTLTCKKCLSLIKVEKKGLEKITGTVFTTSEKYISKANKIISKKDSVRKAAISRKNSEMYLKGVQDARKYYKCNKAFWTTFAITAIPLMAPAGAVTSCVMAFKHVSDSSIIKTVPDKAMLNNELYMEGYRKAARRKRINKIFLGLGLGMLIEIPEILIMQNNGLLPKSNGGGGYEHHHWH